MERFLPLIPKHARVLDLACGSGRHTQLLAKHAYSVLALDRDLSALETCKNELPLNSSVELKHVDLEANIWPLEGVEQFSGMIVTNYLYRPRMNRLLDLIAPGGVVIYETFAVGNEVFGKPSNPNFLLQSQELLHWIGACKDFEVIAFEQGRIDFPKPASIQRICAVRGASLPLQLIDEL